MYKIEKTGYGAKLTFGGNIFAGEMREWLRESELFVKSLPINFGVLIDMREFKPIDPDTQLFMKSGQKLYKNAGMQKSVVVLDDVFLMLQFKRIAKETGIFEWERYIDAYKTENCEEVGIMWLVNDVDPEKKDSIELCANASKTLIENVSFNRIYKKDKTPSFSQLGTGELEFLFSFITDDNKICND